MLIVPLNSLSLFEVVVRTIPHQLPRFPVIRDPPDSGLIVNETESRPQRSDYSKLLA